MIAPAKDAGKEIIMRTFTRLSAVSILESIFSKYIIPVTYTDREVLACCRQLKSVKSLNVRIHS